jgi:hypothetical protein
VSDRRSPRAVGSSEPQRREEAASQPQFSALLLQLNEQKPGSLSTTAMMHSCRQTVRKYLTHVYQNNAVESCPDSSREMEVAVYDVIMWLEPVAVAWHTRSTSQRPKPSTPSFQTFQTHDLSSHPSLLVLSPPPLPTSQPCYINRHRGRWWFREVRFIRSRDETNTFPLESSRARFQ